jgi:hypothetical protein
LGAFAAIDSRMGLTCAVDNVEIDLLRSAGVRYSCRTNSASR